MAGRLQTLAGLAVVVALLLLAGLERDLLLDGTYRVRARANSQLQLISPGPAVMHVASLQHPLAAADLFWLGIVQEIGAAIDGGEPDFTMMRNWSDVATDLDPKYLTVYYAVAINLTVYARDPDASDALLMKGQANLPSDWRLPFMLGYNAYFEHGDASAASDFWLRASELPRAPRYLLSLASRARYHAGDQLGATELLEEMLPHLEGPAKEDAELRLKLFRSEPILLAYDEACRKFREERGQPPAEPAILYKEGLVEFPPEDLVGKPIWFDENCRARTDLIRIREDEAIKRVGSGTVLREGEVQVSEPE